MEPKAKKAFKMPHTLVIILAAVVLTWLIPSGEYVRVEDAATGKKLIDPSSFHLVESTPVTPWAIMDYVVTGFSKSIDLILVILFAGGAFHMVTESGALQASVAKVARRFSSRLYIFIPILTLVFTAIGTSQGVNLFIPFVPITLMLSYALGLDSIVGVGIILLGGAIGFSTGTLQINTTLVAQEIAGLQPYSGIGYRFVCLVVFYVITNAYLIRYAMKIQKDPQLSPMYELDQQNEMKNNADLDSFGTMTWRRWAILAVVVGALGLIVYGGLNLDWEMANFAAMFLWLTVIVGLLDKKGPSAIAKGLVVGCKTMLGAALIIGLARAIAAVLSAGGIIDTIVYAMAGVLNVVPSFLQAPVMFLLNIVINCFITSGSGQAAVVMPLFLPVADLVGMTRQTAILAFNFGDGFCNYVLPTSTALMGLIGAANVPYDKWMKFMWKLFLIWCVTGCVLVSIAQFIRLA
ncbi:MAG: YfcC family protein [Anaerotruncus sp.]|nr:YfcC family protein [Anaerotruncus sp.]MCI9235369.1 YfcC family protein [Anaerotruncus sp.]